MNPAFDESGMNLHQFRFVQEAVRRNLNLTETAKALHTSQPGVSKAILELEEELGVDIFARHGKRLSASPSPASTCCKASSSIMREVGNLKRIGERVRAAGQRHAVDRHHPHARRATSCRCRWRSCAKRYPKVNVSLHQGSPDQVARMVIDEVAEIGLATESLADYADLVTLPCYEWQHVLVMPAGHPLAQMERITLEDLAAEPLISYHPSFTGRTPHRRTPSRTRKLQAATSCSRRSTPTSSRPTCGSAWASASWPRWRCATTGRAATWSARPLGPPVRPERRARRLQARRLPAQLRLRLRRDAVGPPDRA